MATLTGELISETYDSLLKVTDNNTITGIKKRITDGFGNDIPLLLSSTDLEIDGTLILSALTDLAPATKFLSLKADNSVGFRTSSELLSDIGGASSASISGTTGRLSKFTSSGAVGNSILNEIGNVIHLTDGTSSYASFGINNPGIDNDAYIGSTINNDFLIKVNNTEALRIDTAFRLKIANIQNALGDTDKFLVSEDGVVKYRTGSEVLSDIGGASASLYVPYTGATSDVNLGEFGLQTGNIEFDLTPTVAPTTVGSMVWNDSAGTVDLKLKGGNVTLQIGQETVVRVVNKTATNITLLESNYQVVRITGAQGQRPKVDLALANNDLNSASTLGLVTETILDNQEGFITTSGQVQGINTTGSLQGETWADGDIIYLSGTVAGALTNIKPISPVHLVIIGIVEYAHITQGKIFVKVDNGYELEELHNVSAIAPNNNEVLAYDSATFLWKPKTVSTALGYTPVPSTRTITINGTTQDLSANRTYSVGDMLLGEIQTVTGRKDFSNNTIALNVNGASQRTFVSNSPIDSGSYSAAINSFGFNASNNLYFSKGGDNNGIFAFNNAVTRTYTLPNATGTLALTSDLSAYVTLDTTQTITGIKTFNNNTIKLSGIGTTRPTYITNIGGLSAGSTVENFFGFNSNNDIYFSKSQTSQGIFSFNNTNLRTYTFQDSSGTLALTSDLSDYVTLATTQTITGTKTFNSNITSNAFILPAGTSSQFLKADGTVDSNSYALASAISGTTNYIPKFTGANTIGNSSLQTDSSGNLGLGVTPSAWSLGTAIEVGTLGNALWGFSSTYLTNNSYFNSGWKYARNASASLYQQDAGIHYWYNAPSGTAGNAITFTQAMTLGANGILSLPSSGSLEIGYTSSPSLYKLDVNGIGRFQNNSNAAHQLIIENTTTGSNSEAYLYIISDVSAGSTTIGKFSSNKTPYKIIGASNSYLYNGIAGDIAIINDYASGAIKLAAGGSSSAHLIISSTGAATFSSSVSAGASSVIGTQLTLNALYSNGITFINTNVGVDNRNFRIISDQSLYGDFQIQRSTTQGGSTYTNLLSFAQSGAATFSSSVTTGAPSGGTAKPFKVGAAATYGGAATFDRTIEIEIDGTTYYLAAKTTSS